VPAAAPQGVADAMKHKRVKAWIAQQYLKLRACCGITLDNCLNVVSQPLEHRIQTAI
jgi:hypothetical protein